MTCDRMTQAFFERLIWSVSKTKLHFPHWRRLYKDELKELYEDYKGHKILGGYYA